MLESRRQKAPPKIFRASSTLLPSISVHRSIPSVEPIAVIPSYDHRVDPELCFEFVTRVLLARHGHVTAMHGVSEICYNRSASRVT